MPVCTKYVFLSGIAGAGIRKIDGILGVLLLGVCLPRKAGVVLAVGSVSAVLSCRYGDAVWADKCGVLGFDNTTMSCV